MRVSGQHHAPAALPPGKRPGTHCIGDWVGYRFGVDRCGKSSPRPGFDPWIVQPVDSRYTDGNIPVYFCPEYYSNIYPFNAGLGALNGP